jgi:hypothetical protein
MKLLSALFDIQRKKDNLELKKCRLTTMVVDLFFCAAAIICIHAVCLLRFTITLAQSMSSENLEMRLLDPFAINKNIGNLVNQDQVNSSHPVPQHFQKDPHRRELFFRDYCPCFAPRLAKKQTHYYATHVF